MANWLQKILPPAPPQGQNRSNLPANTRQNRRDSTRKAATKRTAQCLNHIWHRRFGAFCYCALFHAVWTQDGSAVFWLFCWPACFLGFALHFLKYPQVKGLAAGWLCETNGGLIQASTDQANQAWQVVDHAIRSDQKSRIAVRRKLSRLSERYLWRCEAWRCSRRARTPP